MIVDGYVRVSHVGGRSGESFLSPAVQREQIERWAILHGALVAEVFEELDESGGRPDRPLLEKAVTRVERGDSEGLVVAYMSRFGRSLIHGLLAIERITGAGGMFVSVQEGLDFSTDIGRHMLRQMLSWAEWELDRNRSGWNVARERAVARGVWMPCRPFGYRKQPGGPLEMDPLEGPIVTDLFRRRAAGASITELRDVLIETGVRTATGKEMWRCSTVRSMLLSRRYRGEVRHGEFFNPNGHEALIDEATWQCAQQYQLDHQLGSPRTGRERALLSGILRCSGCQRALWTTITYVGASFEQRIYYCGRVEAADNCPAPVNICAVAVEPYVEAVFWQELDRPPRTRTSRHLECLKQAVDRRECELHAYRDNRRLPTIIGAERFAQGLAVRTGRVEQARVEFVRAQSPDVARRLPPAIELRQRWASMKLGERRAVLEQVIESVFVLPARPKRDDRLFVCRRGFSPPDLPPRHVHRPIDTRPFDPSTCSAGLRLRRPEEDWDEDQIREALVPFLVGCERWPSFREFQAAGLVSLYVQIKKHVGHRSMASLFDLPFSPPPHKGTHAWSEDRVRLELRTYLANRDTWPSREEFIRDGRGQLRLAVRWFGGTTLWAQKLGIPIDLRRGERQRWSYAHMKRALATLAAGTPDWPRKREFLAAGAESLYQAIWEKGARDRLAADLGLQIRPNRRRWTERAIKAELDRLLEGHEAWPSWSEFRDAGLLNLHHALQDAGTRDDWIQRYGVVPPRPRPQGRWTDEAIRAHLDPLLNGRDSWPRACEFREAGLANLYLALRRAGTREAWAQHYGVPCS